MRRKGRWGGGLAEINRFVAALDEANAVYRTRAEGEIEVLSDREPVDRARHFRQEKSERGSADRAPPDDASERVTSERVTSERQGAQPPGLSPR
jgi:hypothetical protein